jgi:hypothetical protein
MLRILRAVLLAMSLLTLLTVSATYGLYGIWCWKPLHGLAVANGSVQIVQPLNRPVLLHNADEGWWVPYSKWGVASEPLRHVILAPSAHDGANTRVMTVPLWPLWILSFASVALLSYRLKKGRVTEACPHCGYNLRGNASGRCPECGNLVRGTARR